MCAVKIRHKEKCANCRLFVVPGDYPALLGMPDTEPLSILTSYTIVQTHGTNNRDV